VLHLKHMCTQPDSHARTTLAGGSRPTHSSRGGEGRGRAWQSMVTQGVEPSAGRGAPGAPAPFSRPWHTVVFRFQIRTVLSCAPRARNRHRQRGALVRARAQPVMPVREASPMADSEA